MTHTAERSVLETARRQRGVLTRSQALAAGLSASALNRRIRAGRFEPMYRGVYRLGPVSDPLSPYVAAVLVGGAGARISHTSAAALRGWLDEVPAPGVARPMHVTVEGSHRGRRPGIRLHRVRCLLDDERAHVHGIPVTAPARTLIDAAACVGTRTVENMVAVVRREGLLDLDALEAAVARYRGRPGVAAVAAVIRSGREPAFTRSAAEAQFLDLVRRAGLPEPQCNVRFGPYEIDFLWSRQSLAVEIDGFRYHGSRARFEGDRRKDAWLEARGLRVVRLTWRQVTDEGIRTAVQVGQALTRSMTIGW